MGTTIQPLTGRTHVINVGGRDNYRALERDLRDLPSETLRIIAAHIVAEQNRRTREAK